MINILAQKWANKVSQNVFNIGIYVGQKFLLLTKHISILALQLTWNVDMLTM